MRGLLVTVIMCLSLLQEVAMLGSICQPRQNNCFSTEISRAAGNGFEVICRDQDLFQLFAESTFSGVCGFGDTVEDTIGRCSMHESGVFCFEFTDERPRDIERECFDRGGFNRDDGTCTPTCQSAIMDFRNVVGCCGNSLFNYTDNDFARETSYELWSTCNVPTLDFCDTNLNFIAPPRPLTECQFWESFCSEEYKNLFFDPGEDCIDSVSSLRFCGVDESGQFCQLHPVIVDRDDSLAEAVNESCTTYGPTCPTECRRALNEFRDALGCCMNNYFFDDDYNHTVAPELWSFCGVDRPDFCNTTFTAARTREFSQERDTDDAADDDIDDDAADDDGVDAAAADDDDTVDADADADADDDDDDIVIYVLIAVICVLFLILVLSFILNTFLFWRNRRLQK